jgi:peptidoglycan/xylan/chitin deacetylase (PgdA/CDA1 family)
MALRRNLVRAVKPLIPPGMIRQRLNGRGDGCVLLTFDDGPTPMHTHRILDILEQWNAKAVFFVLGNRVSLAPQLLAEILDRGHKLGNHTYTHARTLQIRNVFLEIERCQQIVYDLTGQCLRYFRPPQGRVSPSAFLTAKYLGLMLVHWSFDTGEYSYLRNASPGQLAANLVQNVRNRQIILSHDDTDRTAEMLKLALPRLADQGFDLARGIN